MEFLRNFVYSVHNVSESSFLEFYNIIENKTLLKNHKIVKLGQVPVNFYILKKGIMRSYIVDEKGKEHTKTIFTPIVTSGNLGALIQKKPSGLIYECLTDCEVIECHYESFYDLSKKHHDVAIFHYKVLESVYLREEAKVLELSMLSATERYEKLRKSHPGIDNLINQYHIASFLNITPVQLSRIRKNHHL
ncbi:MULTISPECIES: Crp/Fnr family transcriptional regulator [unclassified Tenacibaculum]|uniref:Crp/Fnr family transcriptional regulator n=1 Tax=unclassified Tenacibaculum TaxID=2635139 RepID=UPI001C4EE3D9|nr:MULTISPECIES: Crp/Fnr family transcriptional regulator [unclassified Tenacibaculum]QXP74217.1 Crp/Fnr family transcriptional regulator [Tenacibaculum sp. AHE14PA]